MKMLSVLAVAMMMTTSAAHAAATAEGRWRLPTGNGEVVISPCEGGALCGRIVSSDLITAHPNLPDGRNKDVSLRTRPLKNLQMLQGFTGGPAEWKNGTVYNPQDGGTYKGTLKLVDDDTLKMTACVVFPACKTQTWRRIK